MWEISDVFNLKNVISVLITVFRSASGFDNYNTFQYFLRVDGFRVCKKRIVCKLKFWHIDVMRKQTRHGLLEIRLFRSIRMLSLISPENDTNARWRFSFILPPWYTQMCHSISHVSESLPSTIAHSQVETSK
jgi:hypothetical protein